QPPVQQSPVQQPPVQQPPVQQPVHSPVPPVPPQQYYQQPPVQPPMPPVTSAAPFGMLVPAGAAAGKASVLPVTVGGILCAAMLCITCLPYIIKSIVFLCAKSSLGMVTVNVIDILAYAAAGFVLLYGTKRLSGRPQYHYSVMLPALIGACNVVNTLVNGINDAFDDMIFLKYAAGLLAILILSGMMLAALSRMFEPPLPTVQKGKFLPFILAAASTASNDLFGLVWQWLPISYVPSFMNTLMYRALVGIFQALLLTGAAALLKRKRFAGDPRKPVKSGGAMFAGAAAAIFCVVVIFADMPVMSAANTAKTDVATLLTYGEALSLTGDMNATLRYYDRAAEHYTAWQTVAEGERYSVPDKYSDDMVLTYLSYADRDADSLRKYLTTGLNEGFADMWAPLMLTMYGEKAKKDELSDEEKAHRDEMVMMCVANECFVWSYPLPENIRDEAKAISKELKISEDFEREVCLTEIIAEIQRGGVNASTGIYKLLDAAEKYPDDMTVQLLAGYTGASTTWDNAGHYTRTAEALMRYHKLWMDRYGKGADKSELLELHNTIAGMLLNMKQYESAIPLLEEALELSPENSSAVQMLANCYSMTNNTEKGYELTRKLYNSSSADAVVIRNYCIGALKNGEKEEAIKAASRLADIVRGSDGSNEDGADEYLFNCVLYLALNDSGSWTDYQYRVYDGENTDETLLKLFESNKFLYDYIRATYYEKQQRDPEKALPYAENLLNTQTASGRVWYLYGMILYDSGKFSEALEAYNNADTLEPDDPSILFALANTYDALEDYQTAYNYCKLALAHFPNGTDHSDDHYGVSYHANDLLNRLKPYIKEAE
ncbi:MAG: tetratricopeptide repeat protein, partial [Ruminiclostridium sp.]|nr:tetratricopeptide repeat protein [Ruminiclostridium sp.]